MPLIVVAFSAEIFEFSDGAWESNVITVPVGQRLGQLKPDGFASDWFVLDILENVSGEVVLLQDIEDPEHLKIVNPFADSTSYRLAQLRQQVKNQTATTSEEDDNGDPMMPPTGPRGGGGGGGGAF